MYGVSIQFKYKNASQWGADEVLLAGEIGLEIDTKKYKLGDGTTAWSELAYYSNPVTDAAASALANRVSANESSISSLSSDMTQAQSDISSLQSTDTTHETRMTTIEAKDTAQDTSIAALEAKDVTHETRMTTIEAKDTEQDTTLTAHAGRLSALEGITVISANPAPAAGD